MPHLISVVSVKMKEKAALCPDSARCWSEHGPCNMHPPRILIPFVFLFSSLYPSSSDHLPPVFPGMLINRLLMKARVQRRTNRESAAEKAARRGGVLEFCQNMSTRQSLLPVFSSDVSPSMSSPRGPQHRVCSSGFPFMFH